jgi:hypothetical protein
MKTKRTKGATTMKTRYLAECRTADKALRRALSLGITHGFPVRELGALIRQLERVTSRVKRPQTGR